MNEFKPDWASPPGTTIQSILLNRNITDEKFAKEMNLNVDDLIEGRTRITLAIARRLNLVLGASVEFWLARDLQYRESLATAKGAEWNRIKSRGVVCQFFNRPQIIYGMRYAVPIRSDMRIVEHLGAIKLRKDGRWNWWRWTSDFHKEWSGHAQGVVVAKADAITIVEEGWL